MLRRKIVVTPSVLALFVLGCGSASSGVDTDEATEGILSVSAGAGATSAPSSTVSSGPAGTESGADPSSGAQSSGPGAGSSEGSSSSGQPGDGSGNVPTEPVECNGTIYACGDLEDNDGDGHIDLFDPECTGPCDDDEQSFQTGIPGDNMDCRQDCFFDGNSGQGEGCVWDLRCDPENPGANIGCEFGSGGSCTEDSAMQSKECIEFCSQWVPPGCDCFGCCTVQTDDGEVDIFLNSGGDCSIDNLDACQSCTPNEDCSNPCNPDLCEVCFGETTLPVGCEEPECTSDLPCESQEDCPEGDFCYLNCCYPPPAG